MPPDREQRLADAERELAEARADDGAPQVTRALRERAHCLWRLTRREEALADLAEVVARDSDDPEVRIQVAQALWMRMSWREADTSPAATLDAARELFARCHGEPDPQLERVAASALGKQADALRALGELPQAIAARRWLITEFRDVRPRNRPDLVFDQWSALASDLWHDGQVEACASTLSDLADAVEGEEVSAPERRLAEAMRLRVLALWRLDRRAESLALNDALQARFATAEELGARYAATDVLVSLSARYLHANEVAPAVALAREVCARFAAESDEQGVTFIGGELEGITRLMSDAPGPGSVMLLAALVARVPSLHALSSRPRLRRAAWVLARLDCATYVNDALAARFAGDPEPARHAMSVRTQLRRAVIYARAGRLRACAHEIEAFLEVGAPAVSAAVDTARPFAPGWYSLPVWTAAILGTTMPLGAGAEGDRTRAAIREVLGSQTLPQVRRVTELRLRALEKATH